MHTMWKGTISFGLVNIPVKMHAATEDKDIRFRQLHTVCQSPIKYEKVCPACERDVANDEIVKGYEYAKNQFVLLEEEDLASIKGEKGEQTVEIMDFVELNEIDPIYFQKSYYLSPNEGGSKAYGLLRSALADTGKIGVAKMMIRSKEQLAVIRIYKQALVVETIHYPDEVRRAEDVPNVPDDVDMGKKELDTAKMLIEQLTTEFKPENYQDDYREAVLNLIEAKKNNEDITTAPTKPQNDQVSNLMDALQASLDKAKQDKPKPKPAKPKRKKTTATTKKKTASKS
ncbi:Non-like proteinous end joining protein Ku [Lentibacillus sp. JNUCC-1]|uniref:non-homologous end joining protein Ku n=1 Tax=Lentibacillus sp. JNUCC-1 TaxID=2654513 RepID=UPI0012E72CC3|nr:Ku protein [Lentibacillus sp. JNUCC-1]MUV37453.1 Non-like proteinous end joining protein Ku [Lentibacillus sp. JNUCC-1]